MVRTTGRDRLLEGESRIRAHHSMCDREGGIFSLKLTFGAPRPATLLFSIALICCVIADPADLFLQSGDTYPEKPPRVRFTSRIFHPNVYTCVLCPQHTTEQR